MPLQPLLAAKIEDESEFDRLRYPLIGTPKLDGIRVVMADKFGAVTRKWIAVPNKHVRATLNNHLSWMRYMDGEIVVGDIKEPDVFNKTQSAVMTHGKTPQFTYYVFDYYNGKLAYRKRLLNLQHHVEKNRSRFTQRDANGVVVCDVVFVPWTLLNNATEVRAFEKQCLEEGYEGIMLRDPDAEYVHGRVVYESQILLKFKRWIDTEGVVTGYVERERNDNPTTTDAFGHSKRSSRKAGKVKAGTLGVILLQHPVFGVVRVGTGFDEALGRHIWANQQMYMGKQVCFSYQPKGLKNKPRFPVFKGFRYDLV